MKKISPPLIALVLSLSTSYPFEILQIPQYGEDLAIGNIFVNPARFAILRKKQISFSVTDLYLDVKNLNFELIFPLPFLTTTLGYRTIPINDTIRDKGDDVGTINYLNTLFMFGIGKELTDTISFGSVIKFLNQEIKWTRKLTDNFIAFDFGISYINFPLKQKIFLGLQNFLISGKPDKDYEAITISGIQRIEKVSFLWGGGLISPFTEKRKYRVNFGLKYDLLKNFEIIGGLKYQDILSPSAGISIEHKLINISFATSYHIDLGLTNNITIKLSF